MERIRTYFIQHPRIASCLQSATIAGFAEVTKQLWTVGDLQFGSVLKLMIMMFFVATPFNMSLYALYDRFGLHLSTKMFLDQFVFSWIGLSLQISTLHILNANSITSLPGRIFSVELIHVIKASWMIWIPAKITMFTVVPQSHIILFQSMVAFIWQIHLSMQYNM